MQGARGVRGEGEGGEGLEGESPPSPARREVGGRGVGRGRAAFRFAPTHPPTFHVGGGGGYPRGPRAGGERGVMAILLYPPSLHLSDFEEGAGGARGGGGGGKGVCGCGGGGWGVAWRKGDGNLMNAPYLGSQTGCRRCRWELARASSSFMGDPE